MANPDGLALFSATVKRDMPISAGPMYRLYALFVFWTPPVVNQEKARDIGFA